MMKLFSHLQQTSRQLLQLLIFIPLLILATTSYAEEDIDGRDRPVEFSQAELDQTLAPIALYPDTVLSQVLIAATYPIEVVQAARWANNNRAYKGADAVAKVEDKDWDPSVKALVAFPDILQRMSDDIDWTQKLGDAFLSNEARVMDTIQNLRKKAYASGSLNKVEHLRVERDKEVIIIEPAVERVVYVPVYDTRVVYGNWWWPDYPPVYWHQPTSYVHVSGPFYWGPNIYIGPSFFFSSCHWHTRRVVVVDRHYSHGPRPVFYTGRSIVHYQNARPWRHQPVHRRGVAYYNNDLRTRYGSQRESYRDARVYREERREHNPRQTIYNERNYTQPRPSRDRADAVRERINARADGARDTSDRVQAGSNRGNPNAAPQNENNNRQDRQENDNNRDRLTNRYPQIERDSRAAQLRSQRENQDTNTLGATRPTVTQDPRESGGNRGNDVQRNREIHYDGRSLRQTPVERVERAQQRQESQRGEQSQRGQERTNRGGRSADEDRQNRPNRAL